MRLLVLGEHKVGICRFVDSKAVSLYHQNIHQSQASVPSISYAAVKWGQSPSEGAALFSRPLS